MRENEVKALGAAGITARTADWTQVALSWADGAGTVTPPGHWNQIAQAVAQGQGLSLAEEARLFALLDLALADAAIREAGADGNPATEADPTWSPLLATPPFPSYSSGHSTFSGAAAEVLAQSFGTDAMSFLATSEGISGVRSYASFSAAAAEAGRSRPGRPARLPGRSG